MQRLRLQVIWSKSSRKLIIKFVMVRLAFVQSAPYPLQHQQAIALANFTLLESSINSVFQIIGIGQIQLSC